MMRQILFVAILILFWNPNGSASQTIDRQSGLDPGASEVQVPHVCQQTQNLDTLLGATIIPAFFLADVRPAKPGEYGADPGWDAGLRFGDFLAGFDGKRIRDFQNPTAFQYELDRAVRDNGIVELEVYQLRNKYFDAQPHKLVLSGASITNRDKRYAAKLMKEGKPAPATIFSPIAGMQVQYLVVAVDPNGPSVKLLKPGDTIVKIADAFVSNLNNPLDADKLVEDYAAKNAPITLELGVWKPLPGGRRQIADFRTITISFSSP